MGPIPSPDRGLTGMLYWGQDVGILINLTHDLDFKNTQVAADIFIDLIEIMEDCTIDDIDIIFTCLKAITN